MIIIKSPRYRLPCGQDVEVKITEGAYKGIYKVKNEDICESPIEDLKTRNGTTIKVRAVPLSALERVE